MKDIWDFAETADLQDVADLLERQIRYNNAIAEEGLLGDYGEHRPGAAFYLRQRCVYPGQGQGGRRFGCPHERL